MELCRAGEKSGRGYMENPQKEDAQSEESSAQYEELPVHSDEDSEESFREEEAGEPPVQLEEDSQTWDSDWTRQFQNMADASERQARMTVRSGKSWSSASVCI